MNTQKYETKTVTKVKVVSVISESIIYVEYAEDIHIGYSVYCEQEKCIGFVNLISEESIEIILITRIHTRIGASVFIERKTMQFHFNNNILGSVINPIGDPIFHFTSKNALKNDKSCDIFFEAENINTRSKIRTQLLTGSPIVDYINPLAHGQRMLLIGDRHSHIPEFCQSFIKTIQRNKQISSKVNQKTICIYVNLGKSVNETVQYVNSFQKNVITNGLIIDASAAQPAGMKVLAFRSACAMARYYQNSGYNSIIIMDSFSKHALAHREISLMSRKPTGREKYSSNIFSLQSSILELAFQGEDGGSITILGVADTEEGEIAKYIVLGLVSITDGQLFFDLDLMRSGICPPISSQYSVSRIGGDVQYKSFKDVSNICSTNLARFYNNIDLYKLSPDSCSDETKETVKKGYHTMAIAYREGQNVVQEIILAMFIKHGLHFNDFSVEQMASGEFSAFITKRVSEIEEEVGELSGEIDDESKRIEEIILARYE